MGLSDRFKDALWTFRRNRQAQIIVVLALLAVVGIGAGYVVFGGNARPSENVNNANVPSVKTTLARFIDGMTVPEGRENVLPYAVVIENLSAARPQAGLDKANLVYEMLVEGGITRFLAIFASSEEIAKIGPVRSARTAFLDIVKELGAVFVHVGGSPEALANIPNAGIIDLNQMYNSQYFDRDRERLKKGIAREHTLYTNWIFLSRVGRDKNLAAHGSFTPWKFDADALLEERPTEPKSLTINFSTFPYKIEYRYNRDKNTYERYQGETPHVLEDGTAVVVKNVVVQYAPTRVADSEGRLNIDLIGEGPAVVFRNGEAISATWKKDTASARTTYRDANGQDIVFTKGTTWVEIVPDDRDVTYN